VLTRQPTGAVYILAMRWISMASAAVGGESDVGSGAGLRGPTRDRYVVLRPQHVVDLLHTRTQRFRIAPQPVRCMHVICVTSMQGLCFSLSPAY
jgi:hypothetical protein